MNILKATKLYTSKGEFYGMWKYSSIKQLFFLKKRSDLCLQCTQRLPDLSPMQLSLPPRHRGPGRGGSGRSWADSTAVAYSPLRWSLRRSSTSSGCGGRRPPTSAGMLTVEEGGRWEEARKVEGAQPGRPRWSSSAHRVQTHRRLQRQQPAPSLAHPRL